MNTQLDPQFMPLDVWVHMEAASYRQLETVEGDWLAAILERIAYLLPEDCGVDEVCIEVTRGPEKESNPCSCH